MRKNLFITFCCTFIIALAALLFTLPVSVVRAEVIGVNDKYYVGNVLDVGEVKIAYNGNEYEWDSFRAVSSNGSVYDRGNIVFDDYGIWEIAFSANIDGNLVETKKTVSVIKNYAVSSGRKAETTYTYNEKVGSYGLEMSIPIGETVELNYIVDVSKSDLRTSFIDFSFIPLEVGKPDAYALYMKLTDIYDEDNYIIVRMKNWSDEGSWADPYIYMDARAANQQFTTTIRSDGEDLYYAKRDKNTRHGWYCTPTSMVGKSYSPVKFYFDYPNRGMITNNPGEGSMLTEWKNQFITNGGSLYMCKFNDPEFYDLNTEKLWEGFTTGEVRISFYASEYNGSAENIFITSILGADFTQDVADYGSPEIKIYDDGFTNFPFAVAGKPYKIIESNAFDLDDGYIPTVQKVYYDYDGTKVEYAVIDGTFYPDKTGEYTIIFSVADKFGKTDVKRVDIDCVSATDYVKVSFDQVNVMQIGETAKIVDHISVFDYNACYSTTVSVYHNGEITVLEDDFMFRPLDYGNFMVCVSITDYVQTVNKWFPLTVEVDDKPIFISEPVIEKYYVKNITYDFQPYYATHFGNDGNTDILCSVYYSENGGSRVKINNSSYTPKTVGALDIIFVAEYNGIRAEKICHSNIVDIGYGNSLDLAAMFVESSGNITKTLTSNNFTISTGNDCKVDFVNRLQAKSFEMSFKVVATANNFNRFYIILTDSEDASICVKFSFESYGNKSYLYINNDSRTSIDANFIGTSPKSFKIKYDNSDYSVSPDSGIYDFVAKTIYGKEFNGFTSNFVNLEFGFEEVFGDAAIDNIKINNQKFYKVGSDESEPQILMDKKTGDKNLNDIIVFSAAVFADIVDVNVSATMKLRLVGGGYVSDINGVKLDGTQDPRKDYSVKLSQLGSYRVEYYAVDASGNETSYGYGFDVVDNIAPSIKLFVSQTSVSVGQSFKIANAVVKDNIDAAPTLSVFVLKPDSSIVSVSAGQNLVADEKGVYTVYYYAFDSNFNSALASYKITAA